MDAAILTVLNKIDEVVGLAEAGYQRLVDVDRQVRDLRSKLEYLMAWIQVAEDGNRISRDLLVSVWVRQIREAVCTAEDIVEEYCHEIFMSPPGLETEATRPRRRRRRPCLLPFPIMEVPVRYTLSQRIADVLLQLDGIQKNSLSDIPDRVLNGGVQILDRPSIYSATRLEYHGSKRRPTGGIPKQFSKRFEAVCVDEYRNAITTTLVQDNNRQRRSVVVITGESGMGKTTVAKEFLKDRVVLRHFDICAWVCLPPESRLDRYMDRIYEQAQEQIQCERLRREDVKQILVRRKYLVVLDGVDNMAQLKSLLRELPDGVNCSGVLVTTQLVSGDIRNEITEVAQVLEMRRLERPDCLALFHNWVCIGPEVPVGDYSMFEDRIYDITRGLPLAVVLLGGLVYCKDHLRQWEEVFELLASYDKMMRLIKRLLNASLATMPPVVKLCFLYLAAMPPNAELDDDTLITLWCAEGTFEAEGRGEATEEEIAERCYSVLVLRGLIQPGSAPFFKPTIHQSVHSFAQEMARETRFLESSNRFDIRNASAVRRLSVHNYVDRRHLQIGGSFPKLRTLLGEFVEAGAAAAQEQRPSVNSSNSKKTTDPRWWLWAGSSKASRHGRLEFLCRHSKFIRVVDLQGARIGTLPESIGDMIHLRYLGLRSCNLKDLPRSVARLLNLETLDIAGNDVHNIVPEFWSGEKLKHVLATKLQLPPGSMGPLRRLMTLHGVISSSHWTPDNCPFTEMKSLLSVELMGVTDATVEMMVLALVQLNSPLHHLRLVGGCIHPVVLSCDLNSLRSLELDGRLVLEKVGTAGLLFFPANLHRLVLRSTCVHQGLFDRMCADGIFELEMLDNSFIGSKLSFQENGFERLRKLKIGNLEELEELVIGESALRYLDTLEIFGCSNMVSIQGLDNVDDLDHVIFYEMPAVVDQIQAEHESLFHKIKHLRATVSDS